MHFKNLIILPFFYACFLHAQEPRAITFDEAVNRTIFLSPTLKISDSQVEESSGIHTQSKLFPNPIFAYSVENVLGNKNWNGWESAESRYELAQLVELGGKRSYRISTAQYQFYASQSGYEATKIDLLNRLMKAFVSVVASQEELKVIQDQKKIAQDTFDTIKAKVDAGKVSLMQQNKAEIALKHAEINLARALTSFQIAKERLALFWADHCPNFDFAVYPFYDIEAPRTFAECLFDLRNNPELIQSQFDHMAAHENWQFERSLAVPDVTVLVGYKTLRDTGNKGMILGASIPLPFFNRNQGNIRKARAEIDKTHEKRLQIELLLENKLSLSHQELVLAFEQASLFESSILASAEQSFNLAKEGYLEGKFEYLDMLDAQRTLFEVKENYIQALLNYHQKRADIEYLNSRSPYE